MTDVDFLGIKIRNEKISHQEHIAEKVQEFLGELKPTTEKGNILFHVNARKSKKI